MLAVCLQVGVLDDVSELHQAPDDLVMLDKIDEPSILQVGRVVAKKGDVLVWLGSVLRQKEAAIKFSLPSSKRITLMSVLFQNCLLHIPVA